VLIPIGGTEQNGPHMALGKHNARAAVLAERIAKSLGNAVVAPVVAYVPEGSVDPPAAHMRFPGTISVPEPAFETVLEGAARSLRRAGFRDIVLLGDHGGYARSVAAVARRLNREWSPSGAKVHAPPEYYRAGERDFAKVLAGRGFRVDEIGTHAGLADTSLTLAVAPALVRGDRMHAAPSAAEGTYGDPRRSSAELGEMAANAIVADTVNAVRRAITQR
jgi:creatinine amidohydrolase/Fe(II)-dependent formamide hydrolase-like protein